MAVGDCPKCKKSANLHGIKQLQLGCIRDKISENRCNLLVQNQRYLHMIQFLLFCIAICAGVYGALTGSLISLLGATLATLLAANNVFGRLPYPVPTQAELAANSKKHGWLMLAFLAIFCSGVATLLSLQNEFNFNSGYLWLISLIAIALSGYIYDRNLYKQEMALAGKPNASTPPVVILDRLDWLVVVLITTIALALRLYRLDDFLPTMHGDEGEMGMLALLALHGPTSGVSPMPLPLFGTAFLDHPTLFHYLQAIAMGLFGESLNGLRTLSAIFGALCVPVVYGIGRVAWGRVAGITAAWLLAVSHFHLQYSRIALNNIETVWFTALFILLLMVAAEKTVRVQQENEDGKITKGRLIAPLLPYAWAGLVMGISQYFYYGSRLIPIVAAPLLLFLLIKRRLSFAQLSILTIATLVAYAPLAGHYGHNLQAFLNRTQGVSIFNPEGMTHTLGPQAVWPNDIPLLAWEQIKRNAAFFANYGDRSAFYFAEIPAFDPLTATLFWLGLGVVLARLYRFHEFALFMWLSIGFTLAGVVTNDAPNGPRLVVITTVIYLIGSVLLQRLFNWGHRISPIGSRWGAIALTGVIMILTFRMNFTTYFITYAHYRPNLLPISMAYDIRQLGDEYNTYLFGAPRFYAEYSVLRFIALGTERYNVETVEQLPSLTELEEGGRGVLVVLLPHRLTELDQVVERLPGGTQKEHLDRVGNLMYVTYQLDGNMAQKKGDTTDATVKQAPSAISQSPSPLSPLPWTVTPDAP